jgi:methyl-accepting chemotaxis protein
MKATIIKTRQSWQSGLMAVGLWGDQVWALHGDHAASNEAFDTSNENTGELLNSLDVPSHKAMDQGLAHGVDLERILVIALTGLFAVASAMTIYYRRRMAKDLIRPVASMHQGVLTLQAGDYGHHIEVARRDELGELAMAFNEVGYPFHCHVLQGSLEALRRAPWPVLGWLGEAAGAGAWPLHAGRFDRLGLRVRHELSVGQRLRADGILQQAVEQ